MASLVKLSISTPKMKSPLKRILKKKFSANPRHAWRKSGLSRRDAASYKTEADQDKEKSQKDTELRSRLRKSIIRSKLGRILNNKD